MKSFSCFKPRDPFRNWSKELDKRVAIWAKNFNSSFKLLLLGPAGAGKTTILKQMKIIHFEGFSLEERQQKAKEIRANLLESVRELTACITASGHQINWCDKENQNRLDFINGLNLDDQTYDLYAAKIYDYSKRILTDKGVEELFAQLNQLSITHRSQYSTGKHYKKDILKEKIERGHRIEDHFPEFKEYKYQHSHDRALLSRAGEKLNLFRMSSGSRKSSSASTVSGTLRSFSINNHLGSLSKANQGATGALAGGAGSSMREKRKYSLYKLNRFSYQSSPNMSPEAVKQQTSSATAQANLNSFNQTNAFFQDQNNPSTSTNAGRNSLKSASAPISTAPGSSNVANHSTNTETSSPASNNNNNNSGSPDSKPIDHHLAYIRARSFIRDKFLQITRQVDHDQRKFNAQNLMYNSKGCVDQPKRNVCYHYTTATDTENIRDLFENLQKMVIKSTMKDLA